MSKVIKTIALVAIAVAVVVFAPQIAGFLGTFATSLGATISAATLTAITSAVVGIGLSLGLQAVSGLFIKTPNLTQSLVDRLNSSVVPTAPRKIVFGTTAAGNDVRFQEKHGKDGYARVIALASHKLNAVLSWTVEDELSWNGTSRVGKFAGGITTFRPVLEGSSSNTFSLGTGSYWNTNSRFTGCAYYAVDYKLDSKIWPDGISDKTTTTVEGCPLYDPRRDSTNGGSGSHRIADQTTWEFRDGGVEIGRNPALALLTYLIGYRISGKVAWGMGVPPSRINFDNFRTYANICEESVATLAGSTVQRYTCDGIFSTADTHETCITQICVSMGTAKLTDVGGQYQLVGGYDDTMGPRQALSERDIVSPPGGPTPYVWTPASSLRDTYNIARGRYADPSMGYQLADWGAVETDALPDGVPRTLTLDLACVSRPETCQRIAKQMLLREAITPGMFTAVFGPLAFALQVGSLCTLSLAPQGWNNKLFRVMEQAETHDLLFQMTLREEDPEVYAWDREEKQLPATIRPPGYDPTETIMPAALACTSASYAGTNNYNVSEVSVTWTPETSGNVAGIQIQSKPGTETEWTEQAALADPSLGEFRFSSNRPGIAIDVEARYRMANGVYSPWASTSITTAPVITVADWSDVTDGSGTRPANNATVGAPTGTYVAGVLAQDVVAGIGSAATSITGILVDTSAIHGLISSESATRASADSALTTAVGTNTSDISTLTTTVANNAATAASATSTLGSTVSGLSGSLSSLSSTVSTQAGTLATVSGRTQAFWQIDTNAGSGADAFVSLQAETSPGTIDSNISLGARELHIYNPGTSSWQKAVDISGGNLRVYGKIIASNFITDQGVDLTAVVPSTLNTKQTSLTTGPVTLALGATSSVLAITPVMVVNGHKALVQGFIDLAGHSGGLASGYAILYRRLNGGSWVSIYNGSSGTYVSPGTNQRIFPALVGSSAGPAGNFVVEDITPPNGNVEYGITFTALNNSFMDTSGADLSNVELVVEYIFYK